jgi:hypothetical protein
MPWRLMMKKLFIFSIIIFFITGCTKLGEPTMHPSDWTDPNSENSHMVKIAANGTEGCKSCHGGIEKHDYFGGSSGVSCYQCHAGGSSGHPAFSIWIGTPESPNFHGKNDINRCKLCHGTNLSGGIAEVSCYTCHETI